MASTFQNPIIRGFNPDPTVCVVPPSTPDGKQTYYLSTSTFEYFPGCAIYKSTDVINWTLIGHALTRPSQLNLRTVEPGAGSWASTLRYRTSEKRWYLFNGAYHRYRPSSDERIFPRGFYVWTDDIEKADSWSDPIYFDNPGFDQDVFWDDDGKTYLSTTVRIADRDPQSKLKDFAIHISEIHLPTGTTLTPPLCIRQSAFGVAEGSHILKKDGWYYLFVAEGGTEQGHQEWVFRSQKGVFGPWESRGEPLWYNGKEESVQRTGHADIFADEEGRWWGVFLGVRPMRGESGKWLEPQLGRETFLVKVDWENNWPIFNNGKTISLTTTAHSTLTPTPQLLERPSRPNPRYQLPPTSTFLDLGWYTKNTPLKPFHSLVARPGFLRLHGSCYPLSSPESPSLLLRKQESHTDIFSTTLDFTPSRKGYEAGITVWWNMYSHACIGITGVLVEGSVVPTIIFRIPNGETGEFSTEFPALLSPLQQQHQQQQQQQQQRRQQQSTFIPTLPSHLSATASPTSYTLCLTQGRTTWTFDVDVEKLCVSPPVGGAFAGVMFGVYAYGEWEPVLEPADFGEMSIREG